MIRRHQRDETLPQAHQRLEVRQERRTEHEHEIDLVGRKRRHRALVVEHLHVELHQRKLRPIGRDLARQEIERERLAACDANGAAPQALQILDLRLHPLDVAGLLADVAHEQLAGRGEADAPRAALEQRRAELFLQVHHAPVHRRGRDMELFSGFADRSGTRDFVDVAQKPQMSHRHRCRSGERVLFGISLARNQRQIATLIIDSVQVTTPPSRTARDLLEWPQCLRPTGVTL